MKPDIGDKTGVQQDPRPTLAIWATRPQESGDLPIFCWCVCVSLSLFLSLSLSLSVCEIAHQRTLRTEVWNRPTQAYLLCTQHAAVSNNQIIRARALLHASTQCHRTTSYIESSLFLLAFGSRERKRKRERFDDHILPVSSHHNTRQLLACCRRFSFVGARGDGEDLIWQIGERGRSGGKAQRLPCTSKKSSSLEPFCRPAQ